MFLIIKVFCYLLFRTTVVLYKRIASRLHSAPVLTFERPGFENRQLSESRLRYRNRVFKTSYGLLVAHCPSQGSIRVCRVGVSSLW